ncbi:MAG: glycosyltransferase family 2 protein [bacterium]
MLKFSIITCALNSAKYLEKNIVSVKSQNFKNFEHIFIDGFSQDKTIELIKNYQKEYLNQVKFFQYPPQGIANAFNKGIKSSSGEYLIFLNSDDYFYDEKVLEDVNKFLESNNFDWIYGQINVIEENGKPVGIWPKHWYLRWNYKNFIGRYFLKFFNFVPHQGVFIKKEVFRKFGNFDESLSGLMDIEYWLRIRNKTKWGFFSRVITNFRIGSYAQSSSIKNIAINKLDITRIRRWHLNSIERIISFIIDKIIWFKSKKNLR